MKHASAQSAGATEAVRVVVVINCRVFAAEQVEADQFDLGIFVYAIPKLAVQRCRCIGPYGVVLGQRAWTEVTQL